MKLSMISIFFSLTRNELDVKIFKLFAVSAISKSKGKLSKEI